jgi:hypothetical protein
VWYALGKTGKKEGGFLLELCTNRRHCIVRMWIWVSWRPFGETELRRFDTYTDSARDKHQVVKLGGHVMITRPSL